MVIHFACSLKELSSDILFLMKQKVHIEVLLSKYLFDIFHFSDKFARMRFIANFIIVVITFQSS